MRYTLLLRIWCVFALIVPALLLSACGPRPVRTPIGTLRWSLEGVADITRLDPARLGGHQENIPVYLIFGGLVRINDRLQIVGEGAERWTVSADGTVYTFYLREHLKYGDGTPVTAQDFADALARTIAPETGTEFALSFLQNVVGAREVAAGQARSLSGAHAIDDHTLELTLDSPRGYFLSQLTYGLMYLAPLGKIEAAGPAWLDQAFGTGPFRVKAREPGKRLVLEGNPHYWAGPPSIQTVEFFLYPDTDAAFTAYQAGEVDIMGSVQAGIPTPRLPEVKGQPGAHTLNAPVVRYVGFNNALPPFNNVFVRQAFAQAVDKAALVATVFGGEAAPAQRILPEGFPGTGLAVEPLGFNPVGARAALGLAGYASGSDLPPVTLTYDKGDQDLVRVAKELQANWLENLGIEVQIDPVDLQTLINRLNALAANPSDPTTGMQMYISVWGADYPDPQNFISLNLQSQSPYNNGHWSNERFDELVDQADQLSGAAQQAERFQLYRDAEQIAVTEVGWLPLYSPQVNLLIRPTVRGLVPTVTPQGILATDWAQVEIVEER